MSTVLCSPKNDAAPMDFETYREAVNPVFVFGAPRSGTTLMYHAMDLHPEVLKLPRDTYFFRHLWDIRAKIPLKALHSLLLAAAGFTSRRSVDMAPEERLSEDMLLDRSIALLKQGNPAEVFSFLSYISYCRSGTVDHTRTRWWAERTNNHLYRYQVLKTWFPSCKFIFCVRDPRAVVASELGALRTKGATPASEANYCVGAALVWVRINRRWAEIERKFGGDVFLGRYEDLVHDPAEFINRIWQFLGVPEMSPSDLHEKIGRIRTFYPSKTGVDRVHGIDTQSVERWRQKLAQDDIARIEDLTHRMAQRFGYEFGGSSITMGHYLKRLEGESLGKYGKRVLKVAAAKMGSRDLGGI